MGGGPGGGMGGGGMGGYTRGGGGMVTADSLRQELAINEDNEWAVIRPKLEKVLDAIAVVQSGSSRRLTGGGMGGGGMAGGMGGGYGGAAGAATQGAAATRGAATAPATAPASNPVAQARQDLQTALNQTTDSANVNVKAKLGALRDAKKKAKDTLAKLQDDLKKVLTIRQEAILVDLGVLE
jgi:hypothetical protein